MKSLFDEGRNCWQLSHANRARHLIDAENYFSTFAQAALLATRSIIILAWDFDSRTQLWCADEQQSGPPRTLGPFLNYLVGRKRGLEVYVLNWDYPMIFGTDREIPPLYSLGWTPRRHVHLRYDNTHPVAGSHHQKVVVIDDALAFSGGLDLTGCRWDTSEHRANDPRRICNGKPYPPFHDVMTMVDGEAAQALGSLARERWHRATGRTIPLVRGPKPERWPKDLTPDLTDVTVGISRTIPQTGNGGGVREVEALYLDMIARARQHIYIENQYFTSHSVGDALARRLAEKDGPEVVLVLRLLSHGWLEEHTMEVLRTQLIRRLRAADRFNRFGVYYPDVPGLKEGTCVDIHSKVMVVDDDWLRIGSANLSNRSMGMDTECDLTFESAGEARVQKSIRDFRDRLLGEHLGVSPEVFQREHAGSRSLNKAVMALQGKERSLRALDELKEWPETVVEIAAIADLEQPVSMDKLIGQFSQNGQREKSKRSGFRWGMLLATVLAVAGLTALWRYTPLAELATADRVIELAHDFAGRWWAPVLVMAVYTPACIVMFPRPLITLFAVVAFGAWLGFAYSMTGVLLSAALTYFAGRRLNRATVQRFAGDKLNRMSATLRKRGLLAVTALRLVPLAPFAVEGLVAGAIRIRLWHFMAGSFLGILPGMLATTVFGDQLETALRDPSAINYWLLAAVAIVLTIATLAVRRWLFDPRIAAA
jgi:phospholipase D1/2